MESNKKFKWSFLVECNAKNMKELDKKFMYHDGGRWEIPHSSVIGILKVEDSDEAKAK